MIQNEIKNLCKEKEQELLDKYFGNIAHEAAAVKPETIGVYTKDLPLKIEAEYREFLEGIRAVDAACSIGAARHAACVRGAEASQVDDR